MSGFWDYLFGVSDYAEQIERRLAFIQAQGRPGLYTKDGEWFGDIRPLTQAERHRANKTEMG
jgi:hypothetical protein